MKSIQNVLSLLNENWSMIVIVICVIVGSVKKLISYVKMTDEQKAAAAINIIKECALKYVVDAELDWDKYKKSGAIKRAEVIQKIYTDYPILSKVANQDKLIQIIDNIIDTALVDMRNTIDSKDDIISE